MGALAELATASWRTSTLRFATHPLVTSPDDDPPNMPIAGRVLPFSWRNEIATDPATGRWAGAAAVTGGEIELANGDGALDETVARSITEGVAVRIKVGKVERDAAGRATAWPLADFGRVIQATAEQWVLSDTNPKLRLRDGSGILDRPVQEFLFSGAGGIGGAEELAGVTKPLTYGYCRNVAATPLGSNLYMLHDGSIEGVLAVRAAGVALDFGQALDTFADLEGVELDAGAYATCLAEGCIKVADGVEGLITVDLKGAAGGSLRSFFDDGSRWDDGSAWANSLVETYVETTAGIIRRLLTDRGRVPLDRLETTSFGNTDRDQPAVIGLHLPAGDTSRLRDVIGAVAAGAGCYFGEDPWGRYELRRFEAPATVGRRLDERHIKRLRQADLPYRVPPWQWQVACNRNWTLQTADQLASTAPASVRQFASRAVALAGGSDTRIRAAYPTAGTVQVDAYFTDAADAAAEAQRLTEVYGLGRGLYELTTGMLGVGLVRGETIVVTYPARDFASGKALRIVGTAVSTRARECRILAFG